jgi:putative SOS response-associated peptidase YedK
MSLFVPLLEFNLSYNIAPSQKVLTIRFNPQSQQRSLDALQWGLIPYSAKDPKVAYRTINARTETVDRAPSSRQAFKKRRWPDSSLRILRMAKNG